MTRRGRFPSPPTIGTRHSATMINFYDIAYGFGVGISTPFWVVRSKTRRKVLDAFSQRMGHVAPRSADGDAGRSAVMIHAVSVGELNAARGLIDGLRQRHPELHLIVSTTTQTGYDRAQALYADAPDVTLILYPLDFSAAVSRVLDTLKPIAVILMELELWPNFINHCYNRHIPVMLANGRITEHSFRNYRLGGFLTRRMFAKLSAVAAQEQTYAERFTQLGVAAPNVHVTGTMKFDTAPVDADVPGTAELIREMDLHSPLWVCGSTGPGEEELILQAYAKLQVDFPELQLAIIPRKPERFDEVAALIDQQGFDVRRRSEPHLTPRPPKTTVILGDTMGELRKFYAAADVVFVGRTLVDLGEKQHGSDMIEPTALGKPTIVGAFTGNFAEVMNQFRAAGAIVEIKTANELTTAVDRLLRDPGDLGSRARTVATAGRGATARTLDLLEPLLKPQASAESPPAAPDTAQPTPTPDPSPDASPLAGDQA